MKKLIIFSVFPFFIACNSGESKDAAANSTKTGSTQALTYSSPIRYSSQFEIGDNKNAQVILDLWKDFDDNTIDKSKAVFADTVTMLFSGMESYGSIDSMMAATKAYRNSFKTVKSRVDAISPINSIDRNEDWVVVWGTEVHTDMNDKVDSMHLQETWRFNKAGKVDMLMQYQRMPPAIAKK